MNRFFALLAILVFLCTMGLSGCAKKCDDLKDVCDRCGNSVYKAGCNAIVNADDQDQCETATPGYKVLCP